MTKQYKENKYSSKMPYDKKYGLDSIYYKEQYTHNGVHAHIARESDIKNFNIENVSGEGIYG